MRMHGAAVLLFAHDAAAADAVRLRIESDRVPNSMIIAVLPSVLSPDLIREASKNAVYPCSTGAGSGEKRGGDVFS
jgi:hypothetical protein